jgi:protein SCO1
MARPTRRLILAAAAGAVLLVACGREAPPRPSFKSVDITGAEYATALELPDVDGKRRHLADFKGKVAVVFFGYTQCPDVCPRARECRASSSASTPTATRPKC